MKEVLTEKPVKLSASGDGFPISEDSLSFDELLQKDLLNEIGSESKTDDEKSLDQLEILRRCRSVKQGLEALR